MQQRVNFKEYAGAFEKKLEFVVADDISTELYCKKYLTHLLEHKKYYLAIYADLLNKLISHSDKATEDSILIDYGAGNGLLGLFAKFCGFKKVFLVDIDAKFVSASEKLAAQLNIVLDGYITGDISAVQANLKNEIPTAIVGTDVIEHIYDLDIFFKTLREMNPTIVSVFTTASNPDNYFKVRMLEKIQRRDELEGGSPDDHILFGESPLEPFLKMREDIIRNYTQGLSETQIGILAKATRGLIAKDITAAVDQYKKTGSLPVPAARVNTCNPLNGSWTERILSRDRYISLYDAAGFTCRFYAGFYNAYESGIMNIVKKLLNAGITTFGKKISPYIVLVGWKKI